MPLSAGRLGTSRGKADAGKVRILVVEDEEVVAAGVRRTLEGYGYEVTSCVATGEDALRRVHEDRPDLVLMDVVLEGRMDGIEAACLIHERFGVPVIYLTGHADESVLERARASETFGYVTKPFHDSQLRATLEMALHRHRSEALLREREEALDRANRWLETLINTIPDLVYFKDASGRHILINRAGEEFMGMGLDEVRGKTVKDLMPPDEAAACMSGDEAVISGGRPVSAEEILVSASGEKRHFETVKVPVYDEQGEPSGLVGISRDITGRKRVEERLRLYMEGIESAPDGVQIVSLEGVIEYSNKAVEEIYGYPVEELRGKHVTSMNVDPEIADSVILPSIRKHGSWTGEITVRHKDGREFPIWLSASLVRDEDGEPIAMVGINRDMTDLKRADEELRRHRERLEELVQERTSELIRANELLRREIAVREDVEKTRRDLLDELQTIFDNLPIGIVYLDANFVCLSVNRFLCSITGRREEELIGRPCYETIGEYVDDPGREGVEKVCSFCKKTKCLEARRPVTFERALGDRMLRVTTVPEFDRDGNVHRFLEIVEDITKRRRAEAERTVLEEQLRHSQKMEAVGQLAGGVAHEFNNRLTAITNCAYILKMKLQEGNPLRGYAEQILASSDKASNLTQSLLALSRRQVIDPKPLDLNEIVKGVERLLSRVIGADVDLVTSLCERELTVMADVGQIEQVLLNLVTNARDAMPEGGRLALRTSVIQFEEAAAPGLKTGLYALLSVSDSGVGMDDETMDKIFEPFFTTKGVGKGTGLGLSIAYGIVKQHKGHLGVESEPERGATFSVYLPLAGEKAESAEHVDPGLPSGGRETLLVAEDDAEVREFTRKILEEFGYRVLLASDGDEAVGKFIEHSDEVKLVLTDVVMPKKGGREVVSTIKRLNPKVRCIFITGYAADFHQKKDFVAEGLNYISKPVFPGELLRKIRQELDSV